MNEFWNRARAGHLYPGVFLIGVVVIFELRKTPKQEAEMIEREDKAISKVKHDPHEMTRWAP